MPRYIHLHALIDNIINNVVYNLSYKGPSKVPDYSIDWDIDYQWSLFRVLSENNISVQQQNIDHGFIVDEYLNKDTPIAIHRSKDTKVLIKRFTVKNVTGWNKDPRVRCWHLDDEEEDGGDDISWYTDYSDTFEVNNKNGITLDNIVQGVFEVKSGKYDNMYEFLTMATCEIVNTNHLKVYLYFNE